MKKEVITNMLEESYILRMFPTEINMEYAPLKIKVGIFTNSDEKAEDILTQIYNAADKNNIVRFVNGRESKEIMMKDKTWYVWIKPIQRSRGHRCRKAYIDQNIDIDTFHNLVRPLCIYCARQDITVI